MFYVKDITNNYTDITNFLLKYNQIVRMVEKDNKYLGIYNIFNQLSAILIYEENFKGYCTDDNPEHIHIKYICKIPGCKHGVFNAALNYILRNVKTPQTKIYLEAYNKKLINLYKSCGFKTYNKNYPHFLKFDL